MAGAIPTPPGWRPIELDLPVPGSQSPYHLAGATPDALRQSAQGYGQAIRTGVQGMIPPHANPVIPPTQGTPGGAPQMGHGMEWLTPFLHQFFEYLRNNHQQASIQPMPPAVGVPQTPFGNGANLPPQVRQILGL